MNAQRQSWQRAGLWLAAGAASLALIIILALVPPEKTLGPVIKIIFLHGALVRIGMLAFLIGGVLGAATLLTRGQRSLRWCLAVQKAAVILWSVYVLSSMVSTRLTWSEWIAWDEPRVRASFHVLWFSIVALIIVLWVNHRVFTGVANVAIAATSWWLVRNASLIRHPFDPIGSSTSSTYMALYWLMVAALLALTGLLVYSLLDKQAPPDAAEAI